MREFPFALDARLHAAAQMIRPQSRVVDVGTDHAYLPVWLVKREICREATGVDINEKPLQKARRTVEKYRVEDRVHLVLSDGLKGVAPDGFDDIVIAGMGGESIADIIENAEWLKNPQKRLILQPMTNAHRLRKYLYRNGFEIELERIVADKKRMYTVMLVGFSGETFAEPSIAMQYAGAAAKGDGSELAQAYLKRQARSLSEIAEGLKKAGIKPQEQKEYNKAADEILRMAEKISKQ